MPTMWTLIKWLPWQQQLERPGSSSGIDRGAGVELTPAGGTRAEGGDTGPAPTYDPISGTRGLFQTPTGISSETQSGCHAQGWKRSHQKHRCHLSRQPPKTDALSCSESRFSWEPGHTRMHTRTHLFPAFSTPSGGRSPTGILLGEGDAPWRPALLVPPPSEKGHSHSRVPVREAELRARLGVFTVLSPLVQMQAM